MKENILTATGIAHSFESELYSGVNLALNAGESIAILGVSGSGKSTILNHLSTLLPPKSGRVALFGSDIYALKEAEILKLRREKIGIIFQAHYLFRGFSGVENLAVAALMAGTKIDPTLLESLKIAHVLNQQIGTLSGGQQQRLSIARVLTKRPQLIIADEPTGNLDQSTAHSVMEAIFGYIKTRGAGMILATHDEGIAQKCSKIYRLENRQLTTLKG